MLVVLEGIDGSGKSTQLAFLKERLSADGIDFHGLTYPRYDRVGGQLVKQYLSGVFGSKPSDVNAFVASSFYAVDRISSYLEDWRDIHKSGTLIVSDRYTTSNAVHQGAKFGTCEEREAFFSWLFAHEYDYLGLPKPDLVILLDAGTVGSKLRLVGRGEALDIHERDFTYLEACHETSLHVAKLYDWTVINCLSQDNPGSLRTIQDIGDEVFRLVNEKRFASKI